MKGDDKVADNIEMENGREVADKHLNAVLFARTVRNLRHQLPELLLFLERAEQAARLLIEMENGRETEDGIREEAAESSAQAAAGNAADAVENTGESGAQEVCAEAGCSPSRYR